MQRSVYVPTNFGSKWHRLFLLAGFFVYAEKTNAKKYFNFHDSFFPLFLLCDAFFAARSATKTNADY